MKMTRIPKKQHQEKHSLYSKAPHRKEMIRKDINFIVGRQLRILRLKQELNGAQMGSILGISQQQVSRYENGVTTLSIDTIVTICIYFSLPLKEFLAPLMVLTENKNESIEIIPLPSAISLDITTGSAHSFIYPQQDEAT
ncbi:MULTISPECIES: helix-turn-helix domain-containing protein [unclassified Providencia]|uniref:helix-turn-helix domain-containing protein n=2 Tax=unclassified Providencia TaxID=2633465 RepID=UPI00300DDD5A